MLCKVKLEWPCKQDGSQLQHLCRSSHPRGAAEPGKWRACSALKLIRRTIRWRRERRHTPCAPASCHPCNPHLLSRGVGVRACGKGPHGHCAQGLRAGPGPGCASGPSEAITCSHTRGQALQRSAHQRCTAAAATAATSARDCRSLGGGVPLCCVLQSANRAAARQAAQQEIHCQGGWVLWWLLLTAALPPQWCACHAAEVPFARLVACLS